MSLQKIKRLINGFRTRTEMGGMGIVVRWHICSIVFILRTARIYSPPFFLRDYRDFLFTPTFILIFHVKYLILPFLVLLPLFIHYCRFISQHESECCREFYKCLKGKLNTRLICSSVMMAAVCGFVARICKEGGKVMGEGVKTLFQGRQ